MAAFALCKAGHRTSYLGKLRSHLCTDDRSDDLISTTMASVSERSTKVRGLEGGPLIANASTVFPAYLVLLSSRARRRLQKSGNKSKTIRRLKKKSLQK